MRHHNSNRKFGRSRNQRKALVRSLAFSLIEREKIETTEAKAKELRPYVEKIITRSKVDTLANRRLVGALFGNNQKDIISKLFTNLGPRYKERNGGYTRITKLTRYTNDARSLAQIEFV
ncbi:MAG TPA: 50S ribosomal protein L17 [Candidatus Paceibacterota bacterium]